MSVSDFKEFLAYFFFTSNSFPSLNTTENQNENPCFMTYIVINI